MSDDWSGRVRQAVVDQRDRMVDALSALVRTPSITGTSAEHEVQAHLADALSADGLEVDHWRLPLDELRADPEFPGTEAERDEAWGVVGRLTGAAPDEGRTLLLDGHDDVVPPGDPTTWSRAPFAGDVADGAVWGRGACDMKGGLVAAPDRSVGDVAGEGSP